MINVLIVEDSRVVQALLAHILGSQPDIEVIGTVGNGEEALTAVRRRRPDVIVMDVSMPKMSGLDATRRIMETDPVPIVIASASWHPEEVEKTFRALEAGAVAVVEKPRAAGHPECARLAVELVRTVRLMSEVRVVRRWPRLSRSVQAHAATGQRPSRSAQAGIDLIAVGASTGGPAVLQTILSGLPAPFPIPILIVNHMSPGFLQGLADWLTRSTAIRVGIASHGERPLPGHAYLAPDGFQMGVGSGALITLSRDEPENGMRPSISYLFRSVAATVGRRSVGVLLTGMGADGAAELKLMRDRGAITIAQNRESSAVHGMPGEAIRLGGAIHVLPPHEIAATVASLVIGS